VPLLAFVPEKINSTMNRNPGKVQYPPVPEMASDDDNERRILGNSGQ
jgi:hypothetical protein